VDVADLRIELLESSPKAVKMRLRIDEFDPSAISAPLLSCISDMAARLGAGQVMMDDPSSLFVTSTSSSYFDTGTGPWLIVSASAIQQYDNVSGWQVSIIRSPKLEDSQSQETVAQSIIVLRHGRSTSGAAGDRELRHPSGITQTAPSANTAADEGDSVADQRRRQIFLGACRVVAEKSYAATTIRDIAKAAQLPISTMYQYISSKEDILFMITKGCMAELFTDFEQSIRENGSATDKVQHAIDNHVKYISKNRKYINLVYRETKSLSRENRAKIFELERQVVALWERIISEGKKNGDFTIQDPSLAAHFIYFLCNVWALRHWAIGQHSEKEIKNMLYLFVFGALHKRAKRE
jgi:AcrR family transcriptional regulator